MGLKRDKILSPQTIATAVLGKIEPTVTLIRGRLTRCSLCYVAQRFCKLLEIRHVTAALLVVLTVSARTRSYPRAADQSPLCVSTCRTESATTRSAPLHLCTSSGASSPNSTMRAEPERQTAS